MDAKTAEIVKAGWAMFARYGYTKTTMSDIATQAGVARQTVYNAFSSKEDILRAVVRHAGEMSLAEIQAAWSGCDSVIGKLDTFQELGPLCWYRAILAAPDWGALMDGMHQAAKSELEALEREWIEVLVKMLGDTLSGSRSPEQVEEAARFFYTTSKNAKYGARDIDDLSERLKTINKATCALLKI